VKRPIIDIPSSWTRSAEVILRKRYRKVLVVGAADRGKSTYCHFLATTLGAAGFKVAFVDADIGQKDVGPPATISLAYLATATSLAQARLDGLYFIGSVDPIRHFLPIVVGTRRLVDAARTPFVIIDTTGLVQGPGRILTTFQIESLQPDALVALEQKGELGPVVKPYRQYPLLRLRSSPRVLPKSHEARRAAREAAFRNYFTAATAITLDLKRLLVQRCLLFNGRSYADPRFIYAEKTPEGLIGISADPTAELAALQVLPAGFEKNLLCGLGDYRGNGLGLGIIEKIQLQQSTITLWTPVGRQRIRTLQFGELYLDRDGRELQDRLTLSF